MAKDAKPKDLTSTLVHYRRRIGAAEAKAAAEAAEAAAQAEGGVGESTAPAPRRSSAAREGSERVFDPFQTLVFTALVAVLLAQLLILLGPDLF